MRGGVTVKAQDLKTRLPEDMFGEIREMHPLLTPKLTNATIRRAVKDYLDGGSKKQRVVIARRHFSICPLSLLSLSRAWQESSGCHSRHQEDPLDRPRSAQCLDGEAVTCFSLVCQ